MRAVSELNSIPEEFRTVVRALAAAATRPEVELNRITPPRGLAPHAVSLAATAGALVRRSARTPHVATPTTSGRFVLLYDPSRPEPWGGPYRVISWLRARIEPEIGHDELLTEVSWSWLTEALERRGAHYTAEAGTASRTMEQGFGALRENTDHVEVEVRASWTPMHTSRGAAWAAAHIEAWTEMLCTAAGLPPRGERAGYA